MPETSIIHKEGVELETQKNVANYNSHSCRVCLIASGELEYLFLNDESAVHIISLAEHINACSDIPLITLDDGFPQYICESCVEMLEVATRFRELCKQSDEQMRKMRPHRDEVRMHEEETAAEYLEGTEDQMTTDLNDPARTKDSHADANVDQADESTNSTESDCFDPPDENSYSIDSTNESSSDCTPKAVSSNKHHKFRCVKCGKMCKSSGNLKRHMQMHSLGKPSFSCSHCDKAFRWEKCLHKHLASHIDVRAFVCEICGKTYKSKGAVYNHRQSHVNTDQFPCTECAYRGGSKNSLKIHMRKHTGHKPYLCSQCPMRFTTCSNLSNHVSAVHDKKKEIPCGQCGRLFFSLQSVRKHMLSHTGLKQFQCAHCPSIYTYLDGLRRHTKDSHPGAQLPRMNEFVGKLQPAVVE